MEALRALLTTYAYNILGSLEEAKDIVQDAYLQFMRLDDEDIKDPRSYLVRTVINLSINRKNRQQKLRVSYHGEWLPEPVATEMADAALSRKDVLSYSLMVLLEKLDARQRAVFILKEAFDYEHTEIAKVLGITTDHSRKILSRAKQQLAMERSVNDHRIQAGDINKYLDAIRRADMQQLEQMLLEDVVVTVDGGGKVPASQRPVYGRMAVMAMVLGIYRKFYLNATVELRQINHQPALFFFTNGKLTNCQVFTFEEGRITAVYFIRNPDKLGSLKKNPVSCHV
jgi:RNA polymerase sigma-70 factor (ECF subfamily)